MMDIPAHIISRLPAEKRAKYQSLHDEVVARHAAIPRDRVAEAYERRERIQAERARLAEHVARDGRRPDAVDRLAEIDQREAEATAEIRRLEALRDRTSEAWNAAGNLLGLCTDRLSGSTATLKAARTPPVKLDRGQTYLQGVEAVRADLAKLYTEREMIALAPAPSEDLQRQALAALDRLAAKGAPELDPRIRGRDPFRLEQHLEQPNVGVWFLIWFLRDMIAVDLETIIGPDQPGTVTDSERANRLAALDTRRLELERQEEAIIVAAEVAGQRIERRPDADPRAILEIE